MNYKYGEFLVHFMMLSVAQTMQLSDGRMINE